MVECNNSSFIIFQVFERAIIYFSIGGEQYLGDPIIYEYMPDTMLKEPRNVSISLKQRVAQFVKIELVFSNVWISISEITFSSTPAKGTFEKEKKLTTLNGQMNAQNTHQQEKEKEETSTSRKVWQQLMTTHSTTDDEKLFDHVSFNNRIEKGNLALVHVAKDYCC